MLGPRSMQGWRKWRRAVDIGLEEVLTPKRKIVLSFQRAQHGRDTHFVKDLGPRSACRFFLFVVKIVIDAF